MIKRLNLHDPGFFDGLFCLPCLRKERKLTLYPDRRYTGLLVAGVMLPGNAELKYFRKNRSVLQDEFAPVKCKLFIAHGTENPLVPIGNAAYAQRKLMKEALVKLTMINGSNHFIPWIRYDTIMQVLMNCIKERCLISKVNVRRGNHKKYRPAYSVR